MTSNNNHLSNINNVTYNSTNYKVGTRSASFNGSNYFQIYNGGQFAPNSDFTIALWVKPVSSNGSNQSIASCRNSTNFTGWMIYINSNNNLEFITGNGTGWSTGTDALYPNIGNANAWIHLAFGIIKSTNSVAVYVNGTFQSTIARNYVNSATKPLRIGAGGDNTTAEFMVNSGTLIDNFQFYSKVLSATEVAIIYGDAFKNSLVAWYNFDGNANDSTTNNNHLSNVANVAYNATDYKLGISSAAFSGSNYFQFNNGVRFSPNSDFTIAFWVKPVRSAGSNQAIASCHNITNFTGWMIYINPNNNLEFWTGNGTGWSTGTDALYPNIGNANTWIHLAFGLNKTMNSVAVYVNGTLQSTIARTYVNNLTKPLRIGAGGDSTAEFIVNNGTLMDDFRFYNILLSATEITTIVLQSIPTLTPTLTPTPT